MILPIKSHASNLDKPQTLKTLAYAICNYNRSIDNKNIEEQFIINSGGAEAKGIITHVFKYKGDKTFEPDMYFMSEAPKSSIFQDGSKKYGGSGKYTNTKGNFIKYFNLGFSEDGSVLVKRAWISNDKLVLADMKEYPANQCNFILKPTFK